MFSKSRLAALTIAISAVAAIPARSAPASPPTDACALVSDAQVTTILGVPMGAGSHVTPTYLKTCTWTPTGGNAKGVSAVTISLQPVDAFAGAKRMMEQAKAMAEARGQGNAMQVASESGGTIGDDAFYTSMGTNYTALLVKKGNTSFKVAIYGAVPVQDAKAKEKALALDVVSKL